MVATAEAFKPYEIARTHGFSGGEFHLSRLLQPTSKGLPKIQIDLQSVDYGQHMLHVRTEEQSLLSSLLVMRFTLGRDGQLDRFCTDGRFEPNQDPVIKVFARAAGLTNPASSYYSVTYLPDVAPSRARIGSVTLLEDKRETGRGIWKEEIAKFGPEDEDRKLYEAFLAETGLPKVADLPGTMRIYLEGQFREGAQMVPLTVEALARRIIMASG